MSSPASPNELLPSHCGNESLEAGHENTVMEDTIETHPIPDDMDTSLLTDEVMKSSPAATSTTSNVHPPPPHIAARFYRPSSARRKGSAASSRRNSISSSHSSLHSFSSWHTHGRSPAAATTPAARNSQSAYIEQHLRRASILEDRKARLADRAAHAEKVRLRAALAKAATKNTSNSEERALAAQQARERNLRTIVEGCAEEVRRAKGIAESMREKREKEGQRLRRDMQERLAEAERRREEILKAGGRRARSASRVKSVSPVRPAPSKKATTLDPDTAVRRIQQRWRTSRRAKILRDFTGLGLTVDRVRDTTFEEVVAKLAMEDVLVATAAVLRLCGLQEGEDGSVNEMTAVRTFLSAYLILGHPTGVLSGKGEPGDREQVRGSNINMANLAKQMKELVAKSRDLLVAFEDVTSRLTSNNNYTLPPSHRKSLTETYATFYHAFIAWKARDSNTMIEMMVLQFVELDSIWQTVKDSTEEVVTESYKEGIRENQLRLMVRIKRLAGPAEAKRLIAKAMRDARRAHAAKKPAVDVKPRAADAAPTSPVLQESTDAALASHLQPLTPPATPTRQPSVSSSKAEELRVSNSILPDNRQVVHELAMDREYRISIEDCLPQRVAVQGLIFASMRREVAAGNSDPWVLAMAENIKGKLQRLLTPGNSMHTIIASALDTELIARELRSGAFSYEKFFSFMASILPRLCAPFRDAEVKTLVAEQLQQGDMVDRLQALLRFIDLMQLDYANFMLQQSAPELIKQAVSYESRRFAEYLAAEGNRLPHVTAAWREASDKVLAEAARRDPEQVNLARAQPTAEKIHSQLMIDVFTCLPSTISHIPETLLLDTARIARIRGDLLRIASASSILLQCKNLLKRDVRSAWKLEAQRVFAVLTNDKALIDAPEPAIVAIQSALETAHGMPTATRAHLRGVVERVVKSYIEVLTQTTCVAPASSAPSSTSSPTTPPALLANDPVTRLLHGRLRTHIATRLAITTSGTERERVRLPTTALEQLAALGVAEFGRPVGDLVGEIARAARLDREAHGGVYERLFRGEEEGE